jgi:hypothetical protein
MALISNGNNNEVTSQQLLIACSNNGIDNPWLEPKPEPAINSHAVLPSTHDIG